MTGAFGRLETSPVLPIWDGVAARAVTGERLTLSVVELDPEAVIPEHAHENEQLGLLLAGSLRFRAGEDVCDAAPGATWSIPPNVPHEVEVGAEGAVVVEVFAPPRADWSALPAEPPRPPRWP